MRTQHKSSNHEGIPMGPINSSRWSFFSFDGGPTRRKDLSLRTYIIESDALFVVRDVAGCPVFSKSFDKPLRNHLIISPKPGPAHF
jgi:hypothetical protein